MSEEIQKPEESKPEVQKPVVKKPVEKRKSPWRKRLILFALGIVLVLGVIGYFKYYFVYSEGTRVGILYKFSKKGTFFKTFEGEMVLPGIRSKGVEGMNSNMFHFSVSDEELANTLMNSQGMELELHYSNYNNSLPWRGDNYSEAEGQYVVDALIKIKDENPNGYGL